MAAAWQCPIGDSAVLNFFFSGLYYKPMMTVNDYARVINKLEASLTDDTRVVIYYHHMFIVQATALTLRQSKLDQKMPGNNRPGANVIKLFTYVI
jgi:hypothetical protein